MSRSIRRRLSGLAVLGLVLFIAVPVTAHAQGQTTPSSASGEQQLKPEQLDALVAPIALYPDALLAEVLMASTYPLEVVEADRWAKQNKNLKGDQLKAAVDKQGWDDSVKSLAATPEVLSMMSDKLDWTRKLGDAVLAQQPDVMDAIQRMRTKAEANNKLASSKEQKVTKTQEQGSQVIVIEPAEPDTIYVPYYDPGVVYGAWPYPDYPAYYFPPPPFIAGGIIRTGIAFGAGYAVGRWASGGHYWGGGFGWGGGSININRPVNINNNVNIGKWQHNPVHRHGVRYDNANVRQKFGNSNLRGGAQDRMDFRGRGGEPVLKPGAGQAKLGANRPGGGGIQRPGAGGGIQRPEAKRPDVKRPDGGLKKGTREVKKPAVKKPGGGAAKVTRQASRPNVKRPSGGGKHGNALGHASSGKAARAQSARGHASMSRGGGGRGGGGGHGGGRARRSDIALKHDIVLLGRLPSGIGFYRFRYNGDDRDYVGVIAQEVQAVAPQDVVRGRDGYLRVFYDRIGVKFQTYAQWKAAGAGVPSAIRAAH